jgi:radical SAM protein with 4Fe4S-binding SPASM domain
MTQPQADFSWVDTFIDNVRPYIFVRLEDNLLIKRPNAAFKLNPMGARILYALLQGQSIARLLKKSGSDNQRREEILNFLFAIKHQLEGRLDEFSLNPAVETVPFEMNFNTLPVLSEVAVTYRCNLKCRFCYAGCNCTTNPANSSEEMSVRQIKKVLRKIFRQAKVPSVSFTGGEPTLVSGLPKLIAYAKSLGMRVNLITNGTTMSPQMARTLAAAGLDSAQVSLEGVTAETHESVVQHKGAFDKSVAAVSFLNDAGILTHTNTTINRLNLEECNAFPRFVKEVLGRDKFSMNLVIPSGSGSVNDGLVVKYSEAGHVLETIISNSERYGVEFMWYSPVPMCMFNSIAHGLGNKGCSACDGLISVAANGDVLPCSSFADSVGNLLREDFAAIWESRKAKDYRVKFLAHPDCKECRHFAVCNGACPLYWQHLGFEELEGMKV